MSKPVYVQAARIGQALSSPVRLRALNLLAQRPWAVSELAAELGESIAATSAHLKILRASCLVMDERTGRTVHCRIASDEVLRLLVAARQAAEAVLPELREVLRQAKEDPHALAGISLAELEREARAGRVLLVDLRPEPEYAAGHLPTARSLPAARLDTVDLSELESSQQIVAYCRGPWCVMARQGVAQMNARGIAAKRLDAGVVEWRAAGLTL